MPLEVTPAPFAKQQLPYTPKFLPPEIPGISRAHTSSIARGPASAAESALIPPAPGGVAGPHRAIPALPDAGYTSPSLHAYTPAQDYFAPTHYPSHAAQYTPGSVFGGASVYANVANHQHQHPGHHTLSTYSEGWGPGSLPAPRMAMTMPQAPPMAPSMPSGWPSPQREREDPIAAQRHHHHHHHHKHQEDEQHENESNERHHHHRQLTMEEDNDDAKSDASYYARPKPHRHRSSPAASTLEGHAPRRSSHLRPPALSPHRERLSPPQPLLHHHSPMASSPLGRQDSSPTKTTKLINPLSPTHTRRRASAEDEEPKYRDEQKQKDREREAHQGHHRTRKPSRLPLIDDGPMDNIELSRKDRSASRPRPQASLQPSEEARTEYRDADGNDDENGPYRRLNRSSLQDDHEGFAPPCRPHQHRHKSHSHFMNHEREASLPPSTPPNHPPPSVAPPSPHDQLRRRAHSFQGSHSNNNFSHIPNPFHSPSLAGTGPIEEYDDGDSVAGSAMTFMDGSIGGRVSQYGLPKYAHQPKVDYRRFCVQRGNADVFLD